MTTCGVCRLPLKPYRSGLLSGWLHDSPDYDPFAAPIHAPAPADSFEVLDGDETFTQWNRRLFGQADTGR